MKKNILWVLMTMCVIGVIGIGGFGCDDDKEITFTYASPSDTPVQTQTPTPTQSESPSPVETSSPTPTTTSTQSSTPTSTPTPTQSPPQIIKYHWNAVIGKAGSSLSYSKYLQSGEIVTGTVRLTGKNYMTDWSHDWEFQILGPGNESVHHWTGHYIDSNSHNFSFPPSYSGTYTLKISHSSSYSKDLTITIQPAGWGFVN